MSNFECLCGFSPQNDGFEKATDVKFDNAPLFL